jgi:hypothetical protein
MKLLPFALVAGLAFHVDYAMAAPMGVIVVTPGPRIAIPAGLADADGAVDQLSPYRISPSFVRPHGKLSEGESSAWWGAMAPGPPMGVHHQMNKGAQKGGCGRKGRKASLVHSFHHIISKLRASLGFPVIYDHHESGWGKGKHYRLKVKEDGSRVIEEVHATSPESFFTRFEHAMRSLSPRESWAVTFVLGCGLGALLRMFIVLAIIFVRGRRGGPRCLRERWHRRGDAQAPVPTSVEAVPPAYTDKADEKLRIISTTEVPAPTTVELQNEPEDEVREIVTVQKTEDDTLMVLWTHVDGSDRVNTASEIHEMYPRKLLSFYEENLKWRPDDEEAEAK